MNARLRFVARARRVGAFHSGASARRSGWPPAARSVVKVPRSEAETLSILKRLGNCLKE